MEKTFFPFPPTAQNTVLNPLDAFPVSYTHTQIYLHTMHWLLLLNKMMWEARYVAKSVLPASAAAGGNTEVHKCVISCGLLCPRIMENIYLHLCGFFPSLRTAGTSSTEQKTNIMRSVSPSHVWTITSDSPTARPHVPVLHAYAARMEEDAVVDCSLLTESA